MMAMILVKRLVGLAITAAILFAGYHYLHNKNSSITDVTPPSATKGIQGAQNAVQQSQNYQQKVQQAYP